MTWVYKQSTGDLYRDATPMSRGYSGCGEGCNNPNKQAVPDVGPIPQGDWLIGAIIDSQEHGPSALRLVPAHGTETYGRSGFMIHGDNKKMDRSASKGCIILPLVARLGIWKSTDHRLTVVP